MRLIELGRAGSGASRSARRLLLVLGVSFVVQGCTWTPPGHPWSHPPLTERPPAAATPSPAGEDSPPDSERDLASEASTEARNGGAIGAATADGILVRPSELSAAPPPPSASPVIADPEEGAPARVVVVGPPTSRSRRTAIETRLLSGAARTAADLLTIEVWARPAEAAEWRKVAEGRIGQPLFAELSDGRHHLTTVGVDRAGIRTPSPVAGEAGQWHLLVDTTAPQLVIELDRERPVLAIGETLTIVPQVEDAHLSAFPVAIHRIPVDGTEPRTLRGHLPNGAPFPWSPPDRAGVHTIEVTAEDLAGNRVRERLSVIVQPSPPRPALLTTLAGGVLRGGADLRLEWSLDRDLAQGLDPGVDGSGRVTLEFTADGESWTTIHSSPRSTGGIAWRVPGVDSNRCELRVVAVDADGLRGECASGRFTVSSSAPRVRAGGIRPAPPKEGDAESSSLRSRGTL
ncbi:MAG: hypothetical protein ACO4B4_11070 [Planctomycetota bacterium]|jgi:hypothetical protein